MSSKLSAKTEKTLHDFNLFSNFTINAITRDNLYISTNLLNIKYFVECIFKYRLKLIPNIF